MKSLKQSIICLFGTMLLSVNNYQLAFFSKPLLPVAARFVLLKTLTFLRLNSANVSLDDTVFATSLTFHHGKEKEQRFVFAMTCVLIRL